MKTNNPLDNVPDFTTKLTRFLRYLLGTTFEKHEVELEDALVLQEKDPENIYLYVEFPNKENGLSKPLVWRINAWRESVIRYERMKAKAAADRLAANKLTENTTRMHKVMCNFLGLPYPNDILFNKALTIAKNKDVEQAKAFQIELDL